MKEDLSTNILIRIKEQNDFFDLMMDYLTAMKLANGELMKNIMLDRTKTN